MQRAIPCLFMRGGTSRGPYFKLDDLPKDIAARDRCRAAGWWASTTRISAGTKAAALAA